MRKPSKGRQRIEIRRIEELSRCQVTFSKRKSGVFKKTSELALLTGAHVAVVVFSKAGKVFASGSPSVDHVLRRFASLPGGGAADGEDGLPALLQDDGAGAVVDREAVEAMVRRKGETEVRVAEEKARMDAVGEKVLQATPGGTSWWEADAQALGEAELLEFARKLRQLRDNVQRQYGDSVQRGLCLAGGDAAGAAQ